MKAYSQSITKTEFLKELRRHQKMDNFVKGSYLRSDGKGCAVGCSINSISSIKGIKLDPSDHSAYPNYFGIPEWIAIVEDTIFEGLPLERSKKWPIQFAAAINTGANLEKAKAPFLVFILKSTLKTFDHEKYPEVKKSLDTSIALWKRKDIGSKKWYSAAFDAYSVAYGAAYAAANAAYAANSANAAYAAANAANAAYAAPMAYAATAAAAKDAAYATPANAPANAPAAYENFADELLRILKRIKK